jgi:transcriptional regulator with XRE-family HTH domain
MPKQIQNNELLQKIVLCIKEIRKAKNITLEVFYFDTGIHLARIEQGKQNISVVTLAKICEYFEIDLSEFFSNIEKMK